MSSIIAFRYDPQAGNAPDAYGAATVFAGTSKYLHITVWDNPVLIQFSYDGVAFGADFEVDNEHPPHEIPYACTAFKIKNKTAGLIGRYQITSFY